MEGKTEKSKGWEEKREYSRVGSILWALKNLWQIDRNFVFFIFATVPVAVVLPLVEAYLPKEILDCIAAGGSFGKLMGIVAAFLAALLLLGELQDFIRSRCEARLYYPTDVYQIRIGAFRNYDTDFENTEKQKFQKVEGYAKNDACQGDCSPEFLWMDLSSFLINLFSTVTYASLLARLNPAIFAVVVFVSVASYFLARWQPAYYEKNKQQWEKQERKRDYLQGLSNDFARAKDIKLYGLDGWLFSMLGDCHSYLLMWSKRNSLRGLFAAILSGILSLLQNGTAYIVLIGAMFAGKITVGEFVFYFGLVGSIATFLQGIIQAVAKLGTRADKIAYYREYFDYPNHQNHGEGCALPMAPVGIEFRDVWYRYDKAAQDTLKGINLAIPAGEKLALVGMNGAGKTTLVKLLCGMYTPTKGEILVGGKQIGEYNIEEYYSMISAVFQEICLLPFTVFEFVASADLERATAREDAIHAMKLAGIWEKVETLENGMDTHLMKGIFDDGVDFSGGETQKLMLARAIYKDGLLLVLDEPTAALDPIAENRLYLQYRELTRGKTSVYISHRFASTRFCDRIVLLEDGVVAESGTHEELMEKNGKYAYMFGVQSKYYKEEEINAQI